MSIVYKTLNLADARQIIAAGEKRALELGLSYNIAVVDAGGNLISHVRMDGARCGSIDIAFNKAFVARAFDLSTDQLSKVAQPDQSLNRSSASTRPIDQKK